MAALFDKQTNKSLFFYDCFIMVLTTTPIASLLEKTTTTFPLKQKLSEWTWNCKCCWFFSPPSFLFLIIAMCQISAVMDAACGAGIKERRFDTAFYSNSSGVLTYFWNNNNAFFLLPRFLQTHYSFTLTAVKSISRHSCLETAVQQPISVDWPLAPTNGQR